MASSSSTEPELGLSSQQKQETQKVPTLITNFICQYNSQFIHGAFHHGNFFGTVIEEIGVTFFLKEPDILRFWLEFPKFIKVPSKKLMEYLHF